MYARKDASKVEVNIILGTRLKFTLHRSSDFGLLSSMKKNMGYLQSSGYTYKICVSALLHVAKQLNG
jgi:hypothetical protein